MSTTAWSGPSGDVEAMDSEFGEALRTVLKHAPSAFAITKGPAHTLVYANIAFQTLIAPSYAGQEESILDVLLPEARARVQALLDRALAGSEVLHEQFVGFLARGKDNWSCTIWPLCHVTRWPTELVIELHKSAGPTSLTFQREVAERLLLAALHQTESADRAEASLAQSQFLAKAGMQLGGSLDSSVIRDTVAGISLPIPGTWCMVDLIELDGSISRLAMTHPDPAKQELLHELAKHWRPEPGDPFGGPAIQPGSAPLVIVDGVAAALEAAAHSPENLRLLCELEIGTLFTVPMVIGKRLIGAVTFLSGKLGRVYSLEEIGLAQSLVARSAEALENARIYAEALALREQAELATLSKMRFLGNISHDLRTPLNAIMGYVELLEQELHGPVTSEQHLDLERIRVNQAHLLSMVNELLNFVRTGAPRGNRIIELPVHQAVAVAAKLIGSALTRKSIRYEHDPEDSDVVALADPERVRRILLNLLANAVKFTPRGGRITTRCALFADQARIRVIDTGRGIAPSQLEAIFEPFIQLDPADSIDSGFGLGLAISRELARSMHGDLTVESELGKGTCFTLTLPRPNIPRR